MKSRWRTYFLIVFWQTSFFQELNAALSFEILNVNTPNANVKVSVRNDANNFEGEFRLDIFPDEVRMPVFSWESKWMPETDFEKMVKLSRGKYHVSLEWVDEKSGLMNFLGEDFLCDPPGDGPWIGDVHLVSCPDELPLFGNVLPGNSNLIRFEASFLAGEVSYNPVRGVLFRREDDGNGEARFVAVEQVMDVLGKEKKLFSGEFSVQGFEPGEYLIELYLYRENTLVQAVSKSFRFEWSGFLRLVEDPDSAIQLMRPLVSGVVIDSLLAIRDESMKTEHWKKIWTTLDAGAKQYRGKAMETYYGLIAEAAILFPEAIPVWERDRVKAYLCYGKPDRRETVQKGGQDLEIWHYNAWGMILPFRKTGNTWKIQVGI